jgi:hypothetical protein
VGDQSEALTGPPTFAHRVLECLTSMKLRVGSLRLRLRLGTISSEEIETRLAAIEQDIDTTAALAQDVQASGGRTLIVDAKPILAEPADSA